MKIYKKELSDKVFNELLNKIKSGKYKEIGEDIIKKEMLKHLQNNPSLIDKFEKKKSRDQFVKAIKQSLYKGVGVFTQKSFEKHHSIKDRDYSIYAVLFQDRPKKIVDLGCGLNPLAYEKLGFSPEYIAIDINESYIKEVNKYFKDHNIKGKAQCKDILQMKTLPKADCYILFKFLESVEQVKNHKISEDIITKIPAKKIIVSFPTKTISGRKMNVPERKWFELMLDRLCLSFDRIEDENEIFYIIYR